MIYKAGCVTAKKHSIETPSINNFYRIFNALVTHWLLARDVRKGLGVCGSTISATRPVPVADDATRTRTRPAPKISTHTRPDPRVYPYP